MKYFTKEIKIGLTFIAALCVLVYGINFLKGIEMFKPSYYIYVKFDNVNGLTKSSPVFADGFRVGLVRDIEYDYSQSANVVVELQLNDDLRIPKGSSAELIAGLMGEVRMNLLLANNPRERYMVGDTIPGAINQDLMGRFSSLMPQLEQIIPRLDSILESLNGILKSPHIENTLQSVDKTTANLVLVSGQLKELMDSDIPQFTRKLNLIGDNFVTISDDLSQIDYAATFSKMESTLLSIKMFTDKLNSKDNSLGLLLNDPSLYNNLNATGIHAAGLLEDLKTNPKRYVQFSLFGKKQK
jgi:phospholipid/cholesterol/gamma-HCH transport system substrate-binding protein